MADKEFLKESTTRELLARLEVKLDSLKESVDKHGELLETNVPRMAEHASAIYYLRLGLTALFCLVGILIPIAYAMVAR